jgi:hypothetical protein
MVQGGTHNTKHKTTQGKQNTIPHHHRSFTISPSSKAMKSSFAANSLVAILASSQISCSSAFAPTIVAPKQFALNAHHESDVTSCDRLTFLKTIAAAAVASPLVAFADDGVGDLSMPSEDEQKAQDVSTHLCCGLVLDATANSGTNPEHLDSTKS